MTTATAMDKFQAAYDAMIESCNFPNVRRVVIKPTGATAEYDMTLTGDPTRDILAIRAAKESGDKVTVMYSVRNQGASYTYNRPERKVTTHKRHDHSISGVLSWNNAREYLVRYHEAKKSLEKLPLRKNVSGHELGKFLTDLHENRGVRRAMVDDTILSNAKLEKIAKYVNGEAMPEKQAAPTVPSVAHKSDLEIVHFDDKKSEVNKYQWVYFLPRGGYSVLFDKSVLEAVYAACGATISHFNSKQMFVIRTPSNRKPISREALQDILYTNPVADNTPAAAPAPVTTPAPALSAEQISAIVAQAVAAALAAIK